MCKGRAQCTSAVSAPPLGRGTYPPPPSLTVGRGTTAARLSLSLSRALGPTLPWRPHLVLHLKSIIKTWSAKRFAYAPRQHRNLLRFVTSTGSLDVTQWVCSRGDGPQFVVGIPGVHSYIAPVTIRQTSDKNKNTRYRHLWWSTDGDCYSRIATRGMGFDCQMHRNIIVKRGGRVVA